MAITASTTSTISTWNSGSTSRMSLTVMLRFLSCYLFARSHADTSTQITSPSLSLSVRFFLAPLAVNFSPFPLPLNFCVLYSRVFYTPAGPTTTRLGGSVSLTKRSTACRGRSEWTLPTPISSTRAHTCAFRVTHSSRPLPHHPFLTLSLVSLGALSCSTSPPAGRMLSLIHI